MPKRELLFAYTPGDSVFHRVHPLSKFVWLLLVAILVFLVDSLILLVAIDALLFLLAWRIGIRPKRFWRQIRWLFFLSLIIIPVDVVFNAFATGGGEVLFYVAYPYFPVRRLAVYVALRSTLWILALTTTGMVFAFTTSPKQLVYGLMSAGIPYRYCFAMMASFRYITVVQQEARTVSMAQRARGMARESLRKPKRVWVFLKERLTAILVSALRRVSTTATSMDKRAFGLRKTRTNLHHVPFRRVDGAFLATTALLFALGASYLAGLLPLPRLPSLYSLFWS